jgi:hypothetical protein
MLKLYAGKSRVNPAKLLPYRRNMQIFGGKGQIFPPLLKVKKTDMFKKRGNEKWSIVTKIRVG